MAATTKWDGTYVYKKDASTFDIDRKVKYSGSDYSIKITNNDYNTSYVKKTFKVKKNTHYRVSVMAKYADYKLEPGRTNDVGACIGPANIGVLPYIRSDGYSGTDWQELSFEFDSGNQTQYELALYNGYFCYDCKGTVYYSDFRLEEYSGRKTNQWNCMVVFFKNVNAQVVMDGKTVNYAQTLNSTDVEYIK
ncbi:MAG: hypothetical protein MJ131_06210 [Lachnospiraceae bacterium]|nr:hypothetical protein [Lachnospiraceae bacterium]